MLPALALIASVPQTDVGLVARLIAPTSSSTIAVGDVETAARSAAGWFVDVRLAGRDLSGALDADLRSCALDNRCFGEHLRQRGIDRALIVVVNLDASVATAELLGRDSGVALATKAVGLESGVERAVQAAVTAVLSESGERRGARLLVEVTPLGAEVRAGELEVPAGEAIYLPPGRCAIEASAAGFRSASRSIELASGDDVSLRLELEEERSVWRSWWLWTSVGAAVTAAVVVPVVALRPAGPATICYGERCASQP